ncbi:Nitrate/nitrite transporter [Mycobacterium marinum str. Europe]|nr:Nitrate/nitrite transporter [Mycobacterium marinum str. Europe]
MGIALLYLCCSGSFLGFAFAFGQVLGHNFAAAGESHAQASLHAAEMAFIGPLLGSFVAHLRRQTGGPGRRWSYHLRRRRSQQRPACSTYR